MQRYLSGKEFGMVPVVGEDYGYGALSYYAVAVVKKSNTDIQFDKLEGKMTCHTGAGKTAGWNVPVGTLLNMTYIKYDSTCNPYVAAGKYFKQSCVPSKYSLKFSLLCAPLTYSWSSQLVHSLQTGSR